MKQVTIRVPASTSNLGSGFDTLGLAVNLYTRVEVRIVGVSEGEIIFRSLRVVSEVMDGAKEGLTKLLSEAAMLFFDSIGARSIGIEVRLSGDVPIARGLGYSATLRVGLLAALNELCGQKLDRASLLNLATQLEGHPDNASPSIYGGFTVSGNVSGAVRCLHFRVPEQLKLVTLVPDFPISTEQARQLMPASFSKTDAVHGLNRAALITAAFASGDLESLRGMFDDRVHQPYREPLIPNLCDVIKAGEEAGALGGFLSGSGSAIICLALHEPERIGAAMSRVLPRGQILVLAPDNLGYCVE